MNENFNNDGMGQSGNSGNVMPPKPNNNLIFAIFTTICCCLPLREFNKQVQIYLICS